MTYWEAADILEHGSTDYDKILEAGAIALKVIKELNKKLDEMDSKLDDILKDCHAKYREPPKRGSLYETNSSVLFVDEFCGEEDK